MSQKRILLVEDNSNDEALTLRALRKNHILNEVVVARDGAEALELLLGPNAIDPELVLLDLKLPKVDGIEVLRRVRAAPRTCLLPMVMLTSSSEESDLIESYRLGVNSFVRKPVDFDQFTEAVRHLGLYWLVLNLSAPKGSELP